MYRMGSDDYDLAGLMVWYSAPLSFKDRETKNGMATGDIVGNVWAGKKAVDESRDSGKGK